MLSRLPRRNGAAILLLPFALLALAGCGSSKSKSSSSSGGGSQAGTLAVTISESGNTAKFSGPSTTKGGLVNVTLDNKGKAPHSLQLGLLKGNHTAEEALKAIGNNTTPEWARAEGGVSSVMPGKTGTATVILPPGKYFIADLGGSGGSGPPAHSSLTVTGGSSSSATLPSQSTTITAATAGKKKYKWQISGSLKPGENKFTFDSKGKDTLHTIVAFRVNGNPSKATIAKALKSNGKPPSFVDAQSLNSTAALDSGKSQVSSLTLTKPGKYVLFCPLADRDEKTPHSAQGLLTTVDVK